MCQCLKRYLSLKIEDKDFVVEVIDSVKDYLDYMKEIFNFPLIKTLLEGSEDKKKFNVLIDSMNGGEHYVIKITKDSTGFWVPVMPNSMRGRDHKLVNNFSDRPLRETHLRR